MQTVFCGTTDSSEPYPNFQSCKRKGKVVVVGVVGLNVKNLIFMKKN